MAATRRRATISADSLTSAANSALTPTTLTPSEFHHTITKLTVASTLRSAGFKSAKSSALEALTRITTLFLQSLSTSAASRASFSCNRTHCNVFDVIHAIEQLSLPPGFPGASDVNQILLHSKTLADLRRFVDAFEEPVFPCRIPRRITIPDSPQLSPAKIDHSNGNKTNNFPRGPEVPRWLPEFPVLETDIGTAKGGDKEVLWEERRIEDRPTKAAKIGKNRKKVALLGRRERVKFKLGGRMRKSKMGGLDELELRNGVCIGGKRVCLVKRVDNIRRFFADDDDVDEKV